MKFIELDISGLVVVTPDLFQDQRGFFMETYHKDKFAEAGIATSFVQDNHSRSVKGTLRGLHYQLTRPQGKLVRVVLGEIFDVAVDVRRFSPTFGQWAGIYLSAKNKKQLWVPPGFAHGFYVLSEWAEVLYKTTDIYCPEGERAIRWSDPDIQIEWPIEDGEAPFLSVKDADASMLCDAEVYS